jgi:hypothetical protein
MEVLPPVPWSAAECHSRTTGGVIERSGRSASGAICSRMLRRQVSRQRPPTRGLSRSQAVAYWRKVCRPRASSRRRLRRHAPGRRDTAGGLRPSSVARRQAPAPPRRRPDHAPVRGQLSTSASGRVGLDHLAFHDLRHTGQTLAATIGATLADLKQRLGHASSAAALRYMHAVPGRDRAIADAPSALAEHGDAGHLPETSPQKTSQ